MFGGQFTQPTQEASTAEQITACLVNARPHIVLETCMGGACIYTYMLDCRLDDLTINLEGSAGCVEHSTAIHNFESHIRSIDLERTGSVYKDDRDPAPGQGGSPTTVPLSRGIKQTMVSTVESE